MRLGEREKKEPVPTHRLDAYDEKSLIHELDRIGDFPRIKPIQNNYGQLTIIY